MVTLQIHGGNMLPVFISYCNGELSLHLFLKNINPLPKYYHAKIGNSSPNITYRKELIHSLIVAFLSLQKQEAKRASMHIYLIFLINSIFPFNASIIHTEFNREESCILLLPLLPPICLTQMLFNTTV